ncbi:MAG: hypothetical protein NUW01_14065 [Gemmatimonadaceae bacterium]|nr:hypothetical protein [Gemmatimonadaceae bacterium]
MPSNRKYVRHMIGGGWATDFGPSYDTGPAQNGDLVFPFLIEAKNGFFELDGGFHKIGGTTKGNSSALESGAEVMGMFDYWRAGTGATAAQKRVVHVGTKIKADAADFTFADIATSQTEHAVPSYCVFEDSLILSNDSGSDAPRTYDQTTCAALGGSPPTFAFCVEHKNRLWAAGVNSNPSRLYYSAQLSATDWSGATAGTIDIGTTDGDRITGLVSYKNELWVFKGPYKGSIYRITGSAPTGSDAFGKPYPFIRGIGAVWHNTIFHFRDDIGFMWSDGSIHSLKATAAYGDFNESALSRPIHRYLNDHLTISALRKVWAVTLSRKSVVYFCIPIDSSNFCNQVLAMDYARQAVWWSEIPIWNASCMAAAVDASDSNRHKVFIGGRDGFVRKADVANRSIDTSGSYTSSVTFPSTTYGETFLMKTLDEAAVGIQPKGPYTLTLGWQRDDAAQQTQTVTQAGGVALNDFQLDDDYLGGGTGYVPRFLSLAEGGEFRSLQLQVSNAGTDEDLEVHTLVVGMDIGAKSLENMT